MREIQHLASVSGGKDSTAVYLLAIESGRPFRAVFADTGNEHPAVYEYLDNLPSLTGGPVVEIVKADFSKRLAQNREYIERVWPTEGIAPDIVARAAAMKAPSGNPYLDLCLLKGRFPSRMAQFCTEELKTLPIVLGVVMPMLDAGPVLQWIGVRAEESATRAKQPRFNRHDSGSYLWRPLFRWTLQDVWAIHKKHGIAPNPLYAAGMGRVGCMPCINCNHGEFARIGRLFPEHLTRIREWEKLVSAASKLQRATFFKISDDKTGAFDFGSGSGCSSDMALCEVDGEENEK